MLRVPIYFPALTDGRPRFQLAQLSKAEDIDKTDCILTLDNSIFMEDAL